MRRFRLPKDIVEYDQWLDKQAEELHKQQAGHTCHMSMPARGDEARCLADLKGLSISPCS